MGIGIISSMAMGVVSDPIIASESLNIESLGWSVELNQVANRSVLKHTVTRGLSICLGSWMDLHSLRKFQSHFISLDTDHDGGTSWTFTGEDAFWLGKGPKHLEESSNLLILGNCLLVESMESVMDSDDLVENRGLWG